MHALLKWNRLPLVIGIVIAGATSAGADKKAQAFGAPVLADSAGLSAPVAGLFARAGRAELRTIVGAPGAAVFGDVLDLPGGVRRVWTSPSGGYAIAAPESGHPLAAVRLAGGKLSVATIDSIVEAAEVVAFSPDGSGAALYSETLRRLYVLTGLPAGMDVREIDLRSLPGELVSAALSEGSALVAIGRYDGHSGAVEVIGEDGGYGTAWAGGNPAALRFAGESLLVSDTSGNRVDLLSRSEDGWSARQLASGEDGLDGPGQIEVLADRKWAVVANLKSESVLWIELGGGKVRLLELPSVAQAMTPVGARNAVVISTSNPDGHWFLAGGTGEPVLTLISESIVGAARQ